MTTQANHEHSPRPTGKVVNIAETCACGWWRWNPNVALPFAEMGHTLDWQAPQRDPQPDPGAYGDGGFEYD